VEVNGDVAQLVEHLLCKPMGLDGVLTCGTARQKRAEEAKLCA